MSRLLASVTNVEEALLALEGGADIIDLKNPQRGALGALPLSLVREIVAAVGRRKPVSATVGDLPMYPLLLTEAVEEMAATGVDIVKIGFFGRQGHEECIRGMQPLTARGVRIVAVMFADAEPDFSLLPPMEQAGFHGAMLDTAEKNGQRLQHHMSNARLQTFVQMTQERGMLAGLAGSLAIADVKQLAPLGADYLGFRGALCHASERKAALDPQRLCQLHKVLHSCNTLSKELA